MRAVCRKIRQADLCLPADSVARKSRRNQPTNPEWAKTLKPGWQRERAENFAEILSGRPVAVDLVNDGWTDIFRNNIASGFVLSSERAQAAPEDLALRAELADFQKMNQIRGRVDSDRRGQGDRRGAEALVSHVLQAADLQRRVSADLQPAERDSVDIGGKGVERVTEGPGGQWRRIRSRLHHLRHGFRGRHDYIRTARFEITGRDGRGSHRPL